MHAISPKDWSLFFVPSSRSSKELHLNGNQPLLKETRIKDEVERIHLSREFSLLFHALYSLCIWLYEGLGGHVKSVVIGAPSRPLPRSTLQQNHRHRSEENRRLS